MKRILTAIAGTVALAVVLFPTGATARQNFTCNLYAQQPTLAYVEFATFNGETDFCFGSYLWTIKIQAHNIDGSLRTLGSISDGPTVGDRSWSLVDPPVLTVKCTHSDGTAAEVRDQLYVNINGEGRTANSAFYLCLRQGGTGPTP